MKKDCFINWDIWFVGSLLLVVISGVTYLPLVKHIGYMNDDWYLMYSAGAYGSNAFVDIFSVDRPGRALVMIPAYELLAIIPFLSVRREYSQTRDEDKHYQYGENILA